MNAPPRLTESAIPERLVRGTPAWELYLHEHLQRYEFFARHARGRTVLDVACGTGYGSHLLASEGAEDVTAIDISVDAIAHARLHYSHPRVQFTVGDAQRLSFEDGTFDSVISFETIEHLERPDAFVREAHRVLRPGGVFVCSTPNGEFHTQEDNPYHLSVMTLDEFGGLIGTYFDVCERFYQSHSPGYLRHLDMVSALERLRRTVRSSRLLRFENLVRRRMGRETLDLAGADPALRRAVPGDYVIEPVEAPADTHLTYILVARKKAD